MGICSAKINKNRMQKEDKALKYQNQKTVQKEENNYEEIENGNFILNI